ncbi:MAG: ornithine--oxo-acid transaminase [Candidatus Puniceispirillum sp.]|nr:ornithine--oxo-acid transaminase [Candidatus Puniceispirillum sp.]
MVIQNVFEREAFYGAPIYHPLPVVLTRGEGVWLWDDQDKRYLDMMSSYSAVSCGHAHPRLTAALCKQANILSLVSRAFYTKPLGRLLEKLCLLSGLEMGIIMNTGAEAVETAIKAARRWGYRAKEIPKDKAEIIVVAGNFHGRTTTIVSFSDEPAYQADFGPLTPGFRLVPYGNVEALAQAITPYTCAVLMEPIQGEAGIKTPPEGYLQKVQSLCNGHKVLLLLDEIQTGFGRTGKRFAFEHDGLKPDGLILGKALGGGLFPVSAFLSTKKVLSLMTPGSHGSTFGGNPLGCCVALETLALMEDERLSDHAAIMGEKFMKALKEIHSPLIKEVRGKGLLIGVEIDASRAKARAVCEGLMKRGVLTKETHETVVRFAPPLIITWQEIEFCLNALKQTLNALE